MTNSPRILVSREPWWQSPPKPGQDEMTCVWEWLEVWLDGTFTVDHTRPSGEEIRARKCCRLDGNEKL